MCVAFFSLVCLLPLLNHPLSLGLTILLVATLASVILSKYILSWFGYSLFLIFVGGLLVMFSYVAALAPNLKTPNAKALSGALVGIVFVSLVVVFLVKPSFFYEPLSWASLGQSKWVLSMVGVFNYSNIVLLVFLLAMLLITMVMVVKICFYSSGPLRPFMYV